MKYSLRKNFTATFVAKNQIIRGKLALKTKEKHWLNTTTPCIILVSVQSAFHNGIDGDLKMNALISTIKNHVKGPITILLSDGAHVQTASLWHQNNLEKAFEVGFRLALELNQRYETYFNDCNVVYWRSYIREADNFLSSLNFLKEIYRDQEIFRQLLKKDAESTYTSERQRNFPNKELFIEKTIEDLLEQCASIFVLSSKGYRFQFYPGNSYSSTQYVNELLPDQEKISWINVFLSIEKKTISHESREILCI